MTLTSMSKSINLPVSTIFERLRRSEETIISRHTCLINFNKLGYTIRANVNIKIGNNDHSQFQKYIKKSLSINNAYRITQKYDYLLEALFTNMLELESFKTDIIKKFKISKMETHYILDDVCREKFMTNPIIENPPQIMVKK